VHLYDGLGYYKTEIISPGETKTLTIEGPQCPNRLEGSCKSNYVPGSTHMYDRCITGKEEASSCPAACYGTDWFIRLHSDRTIHFDKE